MKLLARATVLALLLATAAIAPVQAAPDPTSVYNKVAQSDDPAAAADKLSGAEKKALKTYLTPTKTTLTELAPEAKDDGFQTLQALSGCKETGYALGRYNAFGNLLWTWNFYTEICYDGSRITYSYYRYYGVTYVAFWSWKTVDAHKSLNTFVNPDRLTVFGQGEFKLCVFADIGCVQFSYPWIELRFNANGTYSWRTGG
jgi:hypothetical protein